MIIQPIDKIEAIDFVQQYHYSKVMPKLTKHYLGIYNVYVTDLIGVITLGWGTQPLQTIKKLFPDEGFTTKDYLEIGKMCFHPDYNRDRNTGTKTISSLKKWLKNNTDIKMLYTLADGIVGRIGYVYQASNFLYGGFFWTDVYMGADGEKIHPRSARNLCKENAQWLNKDKVFWLTHDFCEYKNIKRIKGKMFRYMLPLDKKTRKLFIKNNWNMKHPKENDLQWKERYDKGRYETTKKMPKFVLDVVNINTKNVNAHRR